jgi:hypothetical protein
MTIQELLENAQLDSLGLLDEQDRDAFERAFFAAPAPLQAQIRQEQARLCRVDALLPQVDLPENLWPKVREAVRLAQVHAAAEAQGTILHDDAGRTARPLPMIRATGVHRVWRASAIGFATAAVVMGAALVHLRLTAERQDQSARAELLAGNMVDTIGAKFIGEHVYGKNVGRYIMSAARSSQSGRAAIYTSPEWDTGVLYCQVALADESQTLRLVELDEAGNVVAQLDEFEAKGGEIRREVDFRKVEPKRLALVAATRGKAASTGEVVFKIA